MCRVFYRPCMLCQINYHKILTKILKTENSNVILLKWKRVVMRQKDADPTNIVDPDPSAHCLLKPIFPNT